MERFVKRNIRNAVKKGALVLCVLLSLSGAMTGCSYLPESVWRAAYEFFGDTTSPYRFKDYREETAGILIDNIKNRDAQALTELLCLKTRQMPDIERQIEEFFAFVEGEAVSYTDTESGVESYAKEGIEVTELQWNWSVNGMKTDTGKTYRLDIQTNDIWRADEEKEGISRLIIVGEEGKEAVIGYDWKEYHYEGSTAARKIIEAFSEANPDAVNDLLSEKTRRSEDTEKQICAAMDFFEGVYTEGKRQEYGKEFYDGRYAFHAEVREEEKIENHEPVSIRIDVHVENIITDAKKTYEMDFIGYLLTTDGEGELQGINSVVLYGEDGDSVTIG